MDFNITLPTLATMPTELPSLAPSSSVASSFSCVDRGPDYPDFPYICYPQDLSSNYGIDDRLVEQLQSGIIRDNSNTAQMYPFFSCRTNILKGDIPNTDDCDSFCYLQYEHENVTEGCSSCSLVGTDLVYDCRNLLLDNNIDNSSNTWDSGNATPACAARNVQGVCGDHVHWTCFPQGYGYACANSNRALLENDPLFPFDTVLNSGITMFCASDMSGLPTSACEQPRCNIFTSEPRRACTRCQVLAQNQTQNSPYDFAYNCETLTNIMTCPILDETGNCVSIVQDDEINAHIIGISLADKNDNAKKGWTWTLTRIDPTTFNVLSDLFGYATRILYGLAVAMVFPVLMTWQLRSQPIPVEALWPVPGDFFQALLTLRSFACSLPAITLVLLMFFGDFCHTLADLGFDFVDQTEPGPLQPILVISSSVEGRNMARAMVTSGDPSLARTTAVKVAIQEGRINESREQTALQASFLSATTQISRGSSPFVQGAVRPWRETLDFGGVGFNTFFMPDDSPVAVMDREIALDCASTELAVIPEVISGQVFDEPIYNTASIPNCTFTGIRSSGIFRKETERKAEIVEHILLVGILPDLDGIDTGKDVLLRKDNTTFQKFTLNSTQKLLARDREDWKMGRVVDGIFDSLIIGKVAIDIGRVVLANGGNVYGFVAQINGDCPERPSGLSAEDTACLAFIRATCDSFEEDSASLYHEIYSPITTSSECALTSLSIIWGRNFIIDGNLTSVVAGIYGNVRAENNAYADQTFDRHVLLSALFSLGIIEERQSNQTVVRAQVNVQYVVFMLLPVAISVALVLVTLKVRSTQVPIPQSAWDMMVLGQEKLSGSARRRTSLSNFPKAPKDLVYDGN